MSQQGDDVFNYSNDQRSLIDKSTINNTYQMQVCITVFTIYIYIYIRIRIFITKDDILIFFLYIILIHFVYFLFTQL